MPIDSLIWEESALGTLLVDPETVDEVVHLGPADISRRWLKQPWAAAVSLAKHGTLTRQALIATIQAGGDISDIGNETCQGEAYIDYLISLGAPRSMPEFAAQISNASTNRRIIEVSTLAIQKAERNEDAARTIHWLAREVGGLIRDNRDPRLVASLNPDYSQRALKIRSGEIMPFWTPPILALEKKVGAVQDVDFVIVPGKPGTGKSSFLRYSGLETAKQGDVALMVTLENSEQQVHAWALAGLARIDYQKIADPRLLSDEETAQVDLAAKTLAELPYYIVEMGISAIDPLVGKIRKFCLQNPTAIVLVDGLYLIQNGKDLFEGISSSMQTLRSLAQELHVPILGTNQFRKQQKGKKGEPEEPLELGLDDMYFSGEKQATKVWSIRQRAMSEADRRAFPLNLADGRLLAEPKSVLVNFNILKNSDGPAGGYTEEVVWHKPFGLYETLTPDWRKASSIPGDIAGRVMSAEPQRVWRPAPKPQREENKPRWKPNRPGD